MYDIIGDIHGYATELKALLSKLGYEKINAAYQHPAGRKAVFVGDFIDRGPQIPETLAIVKAMCDQGHAFAVMGNHEYNAICFHTPHVEKGGFFRSHSWKEIKQHLQTLEQFHGRETEWDMYLEWFRTLPLFLEFVHFRVVHAYWHEANIQWIKEHYTVMDSDFLSKCCNKDDASGAFQIIEDTLKGIETRLPEGFTNQDKEGHQRPDCRVKWWMPLSSRATLNDILIPCPDALKFNPIPSDKHFPCYQGTKPVFFGHYALKYDPILENPMAICTDYNITHRGKLTACRIQLSDHGITMEFVV
jgi:5'(3')-deoxyribonucleotidase